MSFGLNVDKLRQQISKSPGQLIRDQVTRAASSLTSNLSGTLTSAMTRAGSTPGSISGLLAGRLDSLSGAVSGISGALGDGFSRFDPEEFLQKRLSGASGGGLDTSLPETRVSKRLDAVNGTSALQYPSDLGKYFIEFRFGDYERPTMDANLSFQTEKTIHLPMPTNLVDTLGVNLSDAEMGSLGQLANVIGNVAQDIERGNLNNGTTRSWSEIGRNGANMAAGAGYTAVYNAIESTPGLGSEAAGFVGQMVEAIPNPYMTVFFKGVGLKTHSFRWRFAPRNAGESNSIKEIVNNFKRRMLPNLKFGNSSILGYPQMCEIQLQPNMEELYKFKKCMVSNVTVNYAPTGAPSFFAGTNSPTVIEFEVSLQELEIVTSEDYGGQSGSGVVDSAVDKGQAILNYFQTPQPPTGSTR
jgi:hypothetical protein